VSKSYWSKASTTKGGAPGDTMPRFCDSAKKTPAGYSLEYPYRSDTQGCPARFREPDTSSGSLFPFSEIRTDNAEYRQLMVEAFQQHQQQLMALADESRFFLAQVLWDETMAEAPNFGKPDYHGSVSWARTYLRLRHP